MITVAKMLSQAPVRVGSVRSLHTARQGAAVGCGRGRARPANDAVAGSILLGLSFYSRGQLLEVVP